MAYTKLFIRMLGGTALIWLITNIFAGCGLTAAEYFLSSFLQVLLKSLGLFSENIDIFGPLSKWEPSAIEISIVLLGLGIFRCLLTFLISQSAIAASEHLSYRLRNITLHDLLMTPIQKSIMNSEVAYRLNEIFPKTNQFIQLIALSGPQVVQSAILMLIMILVSWKNSLIAVTGLFIVGIFIIQLNRRIRRSAKEIPIEQKNLLQGIERTSKNWMLVRILKMQEIEFTKLLGYAARYRDLAISINRPINFVGVVPQFLGMCIVVVLIHAQMTSQIGASKNNGAQFIGFLYLFIRFSQNVGSIASYWGGISAYWPQFKASLEIYQKYEFEYSNKGLLNKALKVATSGNQQALAAVLTQQAAPEIEFKNISYRYSVSQPYVLDQLSFIIAPGTQVGLIGASGSGKSTFLALLLGLYAPDLGEIVVGGKRPYEYFQLQQTRVGYVGAEPFLISGSIRDNICYGSKVNLSDDEIWQALSAAAFDEYVKSLPEKLDYFINERGEGLSAGQKQRLSLARAFIQKPQIIILDEASANLDEKTESTIAASVSSFKGISTVVMVSHRPGLLAHCDKIFKFKDQKLILT